MDDQENDLAVSLLDGPFDVTTEFDGIEVSESASIVIQLVNPLGSSQEFHLDGTPAQISVLDESGMPCSSGFVGARCSTCLTLSWAPRKVGFLEDSVIISTPAAPSSITVHCLGTAMPGRASPCVATPSPPPAVAPLLPHSCNSDEATPSTTSRGHSWSDQSTSDGGSSGSNPRLKRVQHRMRKSLAHISEQFEESSTPRSTSVTSRNGHRSKSRGQSGSRRSLTPESAMPMLRQTHTKGQGCQLGSARSRRSAATTTCPPPAPSYYSRKSSGTAAFALPSSTSSEHRHQALNRRNSIGGGDISRTASIAHGAQQRAPGSPMTPRSSRSSQDACTRRSEATTMPRLSQSHQIHTHMGHNKPTENVRASRSCSSRRLSLLKSRVPTHKVDQDASPIMSTSGLDASLAPPCETKQDRLSQQNLNRLSLSLSPARTKLGTEEPPPSLSERPGLLGHSRTAPSVAPSAAPVRDSWSSSLRNTRQKQPSIEHHDVSRAKEPSDAFAIYHTETWQRKQDRAFTGWLNMVLGKSYKDRCNLERAQEVISKSAELRCRHQLGQLREQEEEIVHALNVIEQRIKADRLSFRENSLLDDGSLRKKAVQALMSYNPFWLHLGIDTVLNRRTFQEDSAPESGAVSAADLEAVIREEFLSDTTLLGGASLVRRNDRKELLAQLVIYRVLTLVIILDRIPALMQLPQQAPFLFRLGAPLKSSEDVLTACLHGSLSGIGSLPKQLAKMHYTVSFKQRDIDEWPMLVSSLGTDLSNGIILCKLISLLLGEDIMAEVRKPTAAQRVIKVRNVRIALDAAHRAGIDLNSLSANRGEASEVVSLRVDDIVSGHCREVLALLWGLAQASFAHSVPISQLQTEVRMLERKLLVKGLPAEASGVRMQPGNDGPVTRLLFRWVRVVCGLYGVTLRNCSSSFTDGSAICLLIHHYVPSLIGWSSIAIPPPVPLDVAEQVLGVDVLGGLEGLSWPDYIGMQNSVIQDEIEVYRSGIIHNFELVSKALRCLGDVPEMLSADDITSRYCDERSVLLYLASLCPRLLEFAHEGKAAHAIAEWWRWTRVRLITLNPGELVSRVRGRIHKDAALDRWAQFVGSIQYNRFRVRAAMAVQQNQERQAALVRFMSITRAASAVIMLQRKVRRTQAISEARRRKSLYEEQRRISAATLLQAHSRGLHARRRYKAMQHAVSVISSTWRRLMQQRATGVKAAAATVLQRYWRGYHVRMHIAHKHRAATLIQAMARGLFMLQKFQRMRAGTVVIQAAWRRYFCITRFRKLRAAAITIQKEARRHSAVCHMGQLRHACLVLQSQYRAVVAKTQYQRLRAACIRIQAAWRQHTCRAGYLQICQSTVLIQAAVRRWLIQARLKECTQAAIILQAGWRSRQLRKVHAARRDATVCIQAHWRAHAQQARFVKQVRAIVVVQTAWRGAAACHRFVALRNAAIVFQSMYRGAVDRRAFVGVQNATVFIQAHIRGYLARRCAHERMSAVVALQSAHRGHVARREFSAIKQGALAIQAAWRTFASRRAAATTIQAAVRSFLCRRRFLAILWSAVHLQAGLRGHRARKDYQRLRASTIQIQTALRMRQASLRFKAVRSAAITLQASARGMHARTVAARRRSAICTIQWAWISQRCRGKFRAASAQVVVCQALVRRFLVRRRLCREFGAATTIQAHWRRYAAQLETRREIRLVVLLQAHARRASVMRLHQRQRKAVIFIQCCVRMWAVRVALAQASQAATVIQSYWRSYRECRWYAEMRSATVAVQARWRGVAVRLRLCRQNTAARIIQDEWHVYVWKRNAARSLQRAWRRYIQRKSEAQAATCIQTWWRRYVVVYHLHGLAAKTTVLQAAWRGTLVRRQVSRWISAALILQRSFRALKDRRELARRRVSVWRIEFAVEAWIERRAFKEYLRLDEAARAQAARIHAATVIAAVYRGHVARRHVQPLLAAARIRVQQHQAACILQQAWRVYLIREEIRARCQALAVITSALPLLRSLVLRRHQQRKDAALAVAVTPIQAVLRGWLARRSFSQQLSSIICIQSCIRGWLARKAAGPQVREMAARLHCIELQPSDHKKCLGPRVKAALSQLLSCHSVEQARSACEAAAWGTTYSRNACIWLVEDGAVSALDKFMRVCSTNKSNASLICSMLTTLANILSHSDRAVHVDPTLLAGMMPTISDLLQLFRDVQEVFCLAVLVLKRICNRQKVFKSMHSPDKTLVHWKGVYKVLYNRLQKEGQYLSKLENKKGSDVSACSATRRLISTSEQLKALKELIEPVQSAIEARVARGETHRCNRAHFADVLAGIPQPSPGDWLHDITCGGSIWVPKNTKVRSTFREVLHNVHGFVLPDVLKDAGGREGEAATGGTALQNTTGSRIHGARAVGKGNRILDSSAFHALQPVGQLAVKEDVAHKPSLLPQCHASEDNRENFLPVNSS